VLASAEFSQLIMPSTDDIDVRKPISTYDEDSLVAVEVRSWCFRELQNSISTFDILNNISTEILARTMVTKNMIVARKIVTADSRWEADDLEYLPSGLRRTSLYCFLSMM
jgi:hypothetical protein